MNRLIAIETELRGLRRRREDGDGAARPRRVRASSLSQPPATEHTWKEARIKAMKDFLVANATGGSPQSCIATINEALRILYDNPRLPVGGEVHTTMEALRAAGLATERYVIQFRDSHDRETKGVARPDHLPVVIGDELVRLADDEAGWSVFGMSLLDGYHSVLISVDNRTSGSPRFYWSDQWSTKGGFKEYTKEELDAEVTRLTQAWWDKQPANAKHKTRVSFWRTLGTGP